MQQEQHYDSLTGLLKLSHFLQTSRHLGARKASLLLVDLQHFREINNRFGIQVADRLLSQVARPATAGTASVPALPGRCR